MGVALGRAAVAAVMPARLNTPDISSEASTLKPARR